MIILKSQYGMLTGIWSIYLSKSPSFIFTSARFELE